MPRGAQSALFDFRRNILISSLGALFVNVRCAVFYKKTLLSRSEAKTALKVLSNEKAFARCSDADSHAGHLVPNAVHAAFVYKMCRARRLVVF